MLVNKKEFEILKLHLGYELESDEELKRVVDNIEERDCKKNEKQAFRTKQMRKENPEYGHSKEEIEYMRRCKKCKDTGDSIN